LNPDSSENTELKMKNLPDIIIIDYTRKEPEEKNSLGNFTAPDIIVIKSAQAKLAIRAIKTKIKKAA
jgi:hypothetical protein